MTVPTTLAGLRAKIDFGMSADYVTECLTTKACRSAIYLSRAPYEPSARVQLLAAQRPMFTKNRREITSEHVVQELLADPNSQWPVRLLVENREISVRTRMRGGVGRNRTST